MSTIQVEQVEILTETTKKSGVATLKTATNPKLLSITYYSVHASANDTRRWCYFFALPTTTLLCNDNIHLQHYAFVVLFFYLLLAVPFCNEIFSRLSQRTVQQRFN